MPGARPRRREARRPPCAAARRSRRRAACVASAGNRRPRSPRPAAPRSASATACSATSPSEWPARAGTPSTVTPPSRSGAPGPNGWLSCPNPIRGAAPGAQRLLDAAQVVGQRHLEVRRVAGDRMNRDSTGLQQRGLVGELAVALRRERRPAPAAAARGGALRRLCRGERRPVHGLDDPSVLDPLERLGDRQDRQGRAVRLHGGRDRVDERRRRERAGAVVDEDRPITAVRVELGEPAHAVGHRTWREGPPATTSGRVHGTQPRRRRATPPPARAP